MRALESGESFPASVTSRYVRMGKKIHESGDENLPGNGVTDDDDRGDYQHACACD